MLPQVLLLLRAGHDAQTSILGRRIIEGERDGDCAEVRGVLGPVGLLKRKKKKGERREGDKIKMLTFPFQKRRWEHEAKKGCLKTKRNALTWSWCQAKTAPFAFPSLWLMQRKSI